MSCWVNCLLKRQLKGFSVWYPRRNLINQGKRKNRVGKEFENRSHTILYNSLSTIELIKPKEKGLVLKSFPLLGLVLFGFDLSSHFFIVIYFETTVCSFLNGKEDSKNESVMNHMLKNTIIVKAVAGSSMHKVNNDSWI